MNREDPYRDQAEKLRQNIERKEFEEGQLVQREELPPRSRLHHQKHKKNKWKLKYPIIRLLVLFFILLPITIFSIYSAIAGNKVGDILKTDGESTEGFETIKIEKYNDSPIDQKIPVEEKKVDGNSKTSDRAPNDQNSEKDQESMTQTGISDTQELVSGENSNAPITSSTVYHTVQPGETIYRISIKYYQSKSGIDTIKSVNNLTSNEIRVGQVLTIPLNK